MKTTLLIVLLAIASAAGLAAEQLVSSVSAAGGRSVSGSIVNDLLVGEIGGVLTNGTFGHKVRSGFAGQLTEVRKVDLVSAAPTVEEGESLVLGGLAALDDDTSSLIPGGEIVWRAPGMPLESISANGIARASAVYADTDANISGAFFGVDLNGTVRVLDRDLDNYKTYGADGLPDAWQAQFFGEPPNANAAPDVNRFGTGNNLFKFTAGLNPNDPGAVLHFAIQRDASADGEVRLVISPALPDRRYEIVTTTNLVGGDWTSAPEGEVSIDETTRTIVLQGLYPRTAFFRVRITVLP